MSNKKDIYTQSQLDTLKTKGIGKIYFGWLNDNLEEKKEFLSNLSPDTMSMEDYYKKSISIRAEIGILELAINAKIDFIVDQPEEEEETNV